MKRFALLTTIPSDSHSWPLVFMQKFLKEQGYEVVTLGTCVPFDLTVTACQDQRPELVVLSTVNGHGYIEGVELARRLGELPQRQQMKLVAGGKLGTEHGRRDFYAAQLLDAGFDGVYQGPDALDRFSAFLQAQPREEEEPRRRQQV